MGKRNGILLGAGGESRAGYSKETMLVGKPCNMSRTSPGKKKAGWGQRRAQAEERERGPCGELEIGWFS